LIYIGPDLASVPIYDDDPAEFPEGWHVLSRREALYPYQGPFGATVTLPRMLPAHLRRFTVGRDYSSKVSARQHVAYKAYMALYEAKLLNDHLLPLTSVLEPDMEEEVREMLKDVMKRDGTADVELQIDPWAPSDQELHEWRRSLLSVAGLPALYMLTRVELPFDSTFRLYPRDKDPLLARIQPMGGPEPDIDTLNSAKEWTRIMFWNVHGPHMSWDDTDFEYLFLPVDPSEDATLWASRRLWWRKTMEERGNFRQANALMAPTDLFGEAFSWPTDIDFVIEKKDTPTHRFLSWTTKKLSVEIEEELEAKATDRGVSVHYPIVHARALPRRANFLIPATEMVPILDQHLLPALTRVLLSPRHEVEHALLLPSIIRFMSMSMTRQSFIDAVFAGTPLSAVRPDLLLVALTAPVSQERDNYQRLETLGDCALKLIASVSLFSMHPFWHEGYLSRRKDHMVSNAQLAKHAVRLKLYQWIIRDRFVPRRWKPATQSNKSTGTVPVTVLREADSKNGGKKKKKKSQQQLSTKLLADVVESCIGAAMLTGGWDLAVECVKLFGLGASGWKTVPESVQIILERTENLPDFPSQTTDVEKIIGYTFKRKAYLVEAITHASSQSTFRTTSYERMEFLGDAVCLSRQLVSIESY
jgi:endoribonuclease Dicer